MYGYVLESTNSNVGAVKRYHITTVTGGYWNAGTDANVFITLYGEHGDTGVRQLWRATGPPSSKSFTRNKVSVEQRS